MTRAPNHKVTFPNARKAFLQLDHGWERDHATESGNVRLTGRRMADDTGLNISSLQQYKRGDRLPIIEHCLPLAHFYDKPVDEMLRLFGYPDTAALINAVEQAKDLEAREYILNMLTAMQSREWQRTKWKNSTAKEYAEYFMTRDIPTLEKARAVADQVYSWLIDPNRNEPRARRHTSEQIATLSF